MLAMASTEIDRGRGLPALPAPQLGQHIGERPIAMVAMEQAHRIDRLSAAAVHLQPTVRPVGKALAEAEGWRVHRDRLFHETYREQAARRACHRSGVPPPSRHVCRL